MKLFSQNLNTIRRAWKLSQAEVAEHFNVTSPSYGRWESGTEPKYEVLVEVAKFFKISIDRLLTEELTPQTVPPRWGKQHSVQMEKDAERQVFQSTNELEELKALILDLKKDGDEERKLYAERIDKLEMELMMLQRKVKAGGGFNA